MKKLIVLAVAALVAAPAFANNMKWNGSTDWRYTHASHDDGRGATVGNGAVSEQSTRAHHFRANLGVGGGWKDVEWGVGVRTGGTGTTNTDYVTASGNGDFAIGFEQAWFRYLLGTRAGNFGFTFGRQMNGFAYDKFTQNFFDNDVRFDGIGMSWKWGSFGLNASHYILGARSNGTAGGSTYTYTDASEKAGTTTSYFATMQGIQPHFSWKFRDNIETMIAVGLYNWNKIENAGFTNAVHGVNAGAGYNSTLATGAPALDAGTVGFTGLKQWQIYNTWSLPYKLSASLEYVTNSKKPKFGTTEVEADGKAFSAGLMYGNIRKAHDFKVGYAYGSKDLGSVLNAFSNNRWVADNKGHMLSATYALANNFDIGVKGYLLKEKSKKVAATGVAIGNTQEQKMDLWELTAGVNF